MIEFIIGMLVGMAIMLKCSISGYKSSVEPMLDNVRFLNRLRKIVECWGNLPGLCDVASGTLDKQLKEEYAKSN